MCNLKRKNKSMCICCASEKIYDGDILEITTLKFIGEIEERQVEKACVILDGKDLKLQFDDRVETLDYIDCSNDENANRFFEIIDNKYGEYHINPLDVLDAEYEFYRATKHINNNWYINYPKISAAFVIPMAVNLSFACELFLKGLLLLENKDYDDKHDLRKLYKSLNGKTQNKLFELVNLEFQLDAGQTITKQQFLETLKFVKDYFVKQRYWFEHRETERIFENGLGIDFIKKLCDAILIIVNSRIEEYFNFELLVADPEKLARLKDLL